MKKINNYWTDENNNRWNRDRYTKDQAEQLSKKMINCKYCTDCTDCNSCDYCYSCDSCDYCNSCNFCKFCNSCDSCYSCYSCDYCDYCNSCKNYKSNPERYCKRLSGTVDKLAQIYWIDENVQIVFGCWKGSSIDGFVEKAKKQLKGTGKLQPFIDFAEKARYLINHSK
jgi:hypothetical protein